MIQSFRNSILIKSKAEYYMHFSLEALTLIAVLTIGGFFVIGAFEREVKAEIRQLKKRVNDLENIVNPNSF